MAQRGAEEARKDGIAKLAAWKAAPDTAALAAPVLVSRENAQELPAQIIDAALRTDTSVLPVFVGINMGAQGYAIVKVSKVVQRDVPLEVATKQERSQHAQWSTAAETQAYYNGLKERFKAEILVPKPVPSRLNAAAGVTQ